MRHVFVKESSIPFAGEGLWAKTDIKVSFKKKSLKPAGFNLFIVMGTTELSY